MNTIAEFTIIGRVGEIRQVGATLRVASPRATAARTIAANGKSAPVGTKSPSSASSTHGYVRRNIVKGDLIFSSGSMGQTKWEKDGETFYGVTLAAERIERLCKGPNHGDDKADKPQEKGPARDNSDDIPF